MKTWLSDIAAIRAAGVKALDAGEDEVTIPGRFVARLPNGLKVCEARMRIRIDVTFGERAAGVIKGEDRRGIAGRETVETATATAALLADKIEQAAERASMLRVEIEKFLAGSDIVGPARAPWRARGLAMEIRDLLEDHAGSGVSAILGANKPSDLLSLEAWLPVAPSQDIVTEGLADRLQGQMERRPASAVGTLTEIRDALAGQCGGSREVYVDPIGADIALMTSDMTIRHLLEEAADLRDRAAEYAVQEPLEAKSIIDRAREVENRALERMNEDQGKAMRNNLLDSSTALEIQADMKLK